MKLINDYKLVYVKEDDDGERKLYASKKNITTDADEELVPNLDSLTEDVKLVYEKDGLFYTSTKTYTTDDDVAVSVKVGGEVLFDGEELPEDETEEPSDTNPEDGGETGDEGTDDNGGSDDEPVIEDEEVPADDNSETEEPVTDNEGEDESEPIV